MINKGKARQIEKTAHRLNNHLVMIANLHLAEEGVMRAPPAPTLAPKQLGEEEKGIPARANGRARLRTLLGRHAVNHPAALRAALKTAPESAKPALRRAIAESAAGYKKALEALD